MADRRTAAALAAAVASGVLVAVQARVNGVLATRLDSPLTAALVSFSTGLALVVVVVVARRAARRAVSAVAGVPWWQRLGGLGGAALVAAGAWAAPRIGVALLSVGIVAGQTTGGILVDRAGLGPGGRRATTLPRVLGAALCLVAVVVAAWGARREDVDAEPLLLLAVVVAGFLIAVQQALNGRVRVATGDATVATLVNFVVGTSALALAAGLTGATKGLGEWPGLDEAWAYAGGALGAVFVAVAAVVVRRLGVLRLGLAVVAGQLCGALLLDLAVPADGTRLAAATVLGVLLTLVAVGVSGRGSR